MKSTQLEIKTMNTVNLVNIETGETRALSVGDEMEVTVWGWVFEDAEYMMPLLTGSKLVIDSETNWHTEWSN